MSIINIEEWLGDKEWMKEPGRPDDTDWRSAIELIEASIIREKSLNLEVGFLRKANEQLKGKYNA